MNLDAARFESLWHLADQINMQHAILIARADRTHMVGKMKLPLKGARGDTAVQIGLFIFSFRLARRNV